MFCCGQCARCLEGDQQLCLTFGAPGNLLFGGQGQYFLVNGAQTTLAKIPDALDDDQVLFVTDIMSTGFAAVERAGIRAGATVAVFAQGPVGLCATAGARTLGAATIIAGAGPRVPPAQPLPPLTPAPRPEPHHEPLFVTTH